MTQDHFHCRQCGEDLGHRDEFEAGDDVTCSECGADYEVFENDHPSFAESLRRVPAAGGN